MEFKVGEVVSLPENKYPGVVGTVITDSKQGVLVRFNGTQQLYFNEDELKLYNK